MEVSTASVKTRSMKSINYWLYPDLPFDFTFDGYMNFVKYNESLENRLGTIEEHVDGLINDPETNKLALVAELDLVGHKIKNYIKWNYPAKNLKRWLYKVIIEKTTSDLQSDARVKDYLLDFVRIKLQFMERLLDFVNHRIKHIKNWYLMPADQGITSKEARSLAKGQQLIFPFPGGLRLKWVRTATEFMEVFVPLCMTGAFRFLDDTKPSQTQSIEFFANLLNLKISNPDSLLHTARNRKKDATPYLTELQRVFTNSDAD
ncbi:MAG: hypothetical protein ACKOCO_14460 [Bacteroidota bacterium]